MESIRRKVSVVGQKISTSQDLPLSAALKRVLHHAAEEVDPIGDQHIRSTHLLVGLLAEAGSVGAKLLNQQGVTLESVRAKLGV
jgi:ATP-dependent Clp protease ATP-binding subunit ClpA